MKIECEKNKLEKALGLAERATSKNPTLPILSYILLNAEGGSLKIKATNLEVGVEIIIPAKVEEGGTVAIKASVALGFLSNVNDEKNVVIESKDNGIQIKTKGGEANIKGINHEDFPEIPKISGGVAVNLPGESVAEGIFSVAYSASISQVKPELASVVIGSDHKNIVFVSTDSFRLAEKKIHTDLTKDIPQTIVPIKNVIELARVAEEFEKENVKLLFAKNQIAIQGSGIYFVSRVVDGSFPDYKQIIPKESKTEAVMLKEDLSRALKTAVVFSDSFNQTTIIVSPNKKRIEFKSKNSDIGEGSTVFTAALSGEAMEMSFNHRYLSDCLATINSDSVSFSFSGSNKPTLIRGVSDASFLYVVMPMNR